MAKRKRRSTTRKRARKRRKRAARKYSNSKLGFTRSVGGFPKKIRTTMVYAQEITTVAAAAAGYSPASTQYPIFRNSIHDPYYLTGGHQPYMHDQWAPIYTHYKVLGMKVTFTWINNPSVPFQIFVTGAPTATQLHLALASVTHTHLIEEPLTRNGPIVQAHLDHTETRSVTYYFSAKKQLFKTAGRNAPTAFGSNPATSQDWYIGSVPCPIDPTQIMPAIKGNVRIQYIVELSQPDVVGQS